MQDFVCPACHAYYADVMIVRGTRASAAGMHCHACGARLDWVPRIGRMDALEPFQKFAIVDTVRGREVVTEVDSLHRLRAIERDAEQRARNGEGRPLVWRDYAQDRSNRDVHTLAADPADPHGTKAAIARHLAKAKPSRDHVAQRGEAVTTVHGTL